MEYNPVDADYDGTAEGIITQLRRYPGRTAEANFPNSGMVLYMAYFPVHEPFPFVVEVRSVAQPWEDLGTLMLKETGLTVEELVTRIHVMQVREFFVSQGEAVPDGIREELTDHLRQAAVKAGENLAAEDIDSLTAEIEEYLRKRAGE